MSQKQEVGEGGRAYQAQGNITVNTGLSPDQMIDIINALGNQVQRGVQAAEERIGERLEEFRKIVLEEWSRPENSARSEAFEDPDFQYVLHSAQKSYARSGEKGLAKELSKLLAIRSSEINRTRASFILNESIEKAPLLTEQELSLMCIIFMIRDANLYDFKYENLVSRYSSLIYPYLENFPRDEASCEYLKSLGCISPAGEATAIWHTIFRHRSGIYGIDFPISEISDIDVKKLQGMVFQSAPHFARFVPTYSVGLKGFFDRGQFSELEKDKLNLLYGKYCIKTDKITKALDFALPGLHNLWWMSKANNMQLTAVGRAIAYTTLNSRNGLILDREKWIK